MKVKTLLILSLVVLTGLLLVNLTRQKTKTSFYDLQIEAVNKVITAYDIIKEKKEELNIPINSEVDPLETGLIGIGAQLEGFSITTTLGHLYSKQTSLNPNFVSLIVYYLLSLNLKENDSVAVNFSSSFPALNIMVLIALDSLNINYLIMSSIGASTYGANIVDFPYLKMEEELFNKGIINKKTEVMSLGGEKDVLDGIKENNESFINSLYEQYSDMVQIKEQNFQKNVNYRYDYYNNNLNNIKAFINVGGNSSGMGLGYKTYENGLLKPKSYRIDKNSGLIERFLNDGVNVINLLNIISLAEKNGLEVFTEKPFTVGVGDCYYVYKYEAIIIVMTIFLAFIVIILDFEKRSFIKNLKEVVLENEK